MALMFFAFKKWMKPSVDFAVKVRVLLWGWGKTAAGKHVKQCHTVDPTFQSKHFALY